MTDNTEKNRKAVSKRAVWKSGRAAKGSLNKTTRACQEMLNGEAEAITRKAVDKALKGDMTAIKLCLERLLPQRKEAPVNVNLPAINKDSDLPKFTAALIEAVTTGEITISEAQGLLTLAISHQKRNYTG